MAGNGGGMGPRVLQVLEFAQARAPELQALRELAHDSRVQSAADEKLAAQQNQRRRRANAFNSFRMPQRLKQRGRRGRQPERETTGEAQGGRDGERRCRVHERRLHKLLELRSWEAAAETGKDVMLPTHLWHAKRMEMQARHGVVVAERRADKGVSAALEGLRKTAVVHDASYYGVLELYGQPQLLLEALQFVSDPAGSDFDGMRFLSGGQEGRGMLFHAGQFPSGAICPVTFMWRPLQSDWRDESGGGDAKFELREEWESSKRQLWLWIHPAAFMEAATAVAAACREVVDDGQEVEINDRRGHLCRFKVRGKRADEIVASLCEAECAVGDSTQVNEAASDHEDGFDPSQTAAICAKTSRLSLLKAVRPSSKAPSSTMENSGAVYSVAVADPRRCHTGSQAKPLDTTLGTFSLLKEPPTNAVGQVGVDEIVSPLTGLSLSSLGKRAEEPESARILQELANVLAWTTKAQAESTSGYPYESPNLRSDAGTALDFMESLDTSQAGPPCSWLWSLSKREALLRGFRKDHELNADTLRKRRLASRLLSSSTAEPIGLEEAAPDAESLLHLLVVRQVESFPDTSGWDLVCSPSMALVLLKALVFRGGMVVGAEEDAAIATVLHSPSFPRDFPDTRAGQEFWREIAHKLQEEHGRKPKAKRVAFDKLGVESPFEPKWSELFQEADADVVMLPEAETETEPVEDDEDASKTLCVLRGATYMEPFCFSPTLASDPSPVFIPVAVPTLVSVVVSVLRRGTLCPNTMLYAPSEEDQAAFKLDNKWSGAPVARSEQRSLVGYVTSAVYDRPKAAFRALGFCSCEALQRLFLAQMDSSEASRVFALARPPQGKMLRPVRLDVLTG